MIKAWHTFCGDPMDGSLLVFADTRNRARMVAKNMGPYDWEWYIDIDAVRAPGWDGLFNREIAIWENAELPEDAVPFYNDSETRR